MDLRESQQFSHETKYGLVAQSHVIPSSSELRKNSFNFQKWLVSVSFLLSVGCVVATVLVVFSSDGEPVEDWKIRPSVILALLASVLSILLGYLLSTGISVQWWSSARRGTSLEHLHEMTNRSILLQPHHWKWKLFQDCGFLKIFIATCFIVLSAFTSQPFVQQATRVSGTTVQESGLSMNINILPEFPDGLSGLVNNDILAAATGSLDLSAAAVQWYNNDTIRQSIVGGYLCPGICTGVVTSPGISVECVATEESHNLKSQSVSDLDLFMLNFTMADDNSIPYIAFVVTYSRHVDRDCQATIVTENCKIYSARTQYPVELRNDTLTLEPRTYWDLNSTNRTYSPGDALSAKDGIKAGPLRGIMYMAQLYFYSFTKLRTKDFVLPTQGLATEMFYIYSNRTTRDTLPKGCDLTWRRPTDYVLNGISQMLFRLALNGNSIANSTTAGNATPVKQTYPVELTETKVVFKSNYVWLAAAVVVEALATLLAIVLLWGWWGLDREVTLSPVETLQSMPALSFPGDLSADEIIEINGSRRVNYDAIRYRQVGPNV